jgi:hypothetical protein
MAGKVSASFAPMAGLSLYGAAVYAVRDQVAAGVDDQMGTEFDLVANYGIAENVTLTVGGGYWWPATTTMTWTIRAVAFTTKFSFATATSAPGGFAPGVFSFLPVLTSPAPACYTARCGEVRRTSPVHALAG